MRLTAAIAAAGIQRRPCSRAKWTALLDAGLLAAPGIHFGHDLASRCHMRLNATTTSRDAVEELARLVSQAQPTAFER